LEKSYSSKYFVLDENNNKVFIYKYGAFNKDHQILDLNKNVLATFNINNIDKNLKNGNFSIEFTEIKHQPTITFKNSSSYKIPNYIFNVSDNDNGERLLNAVFDKDSSTISIYNGTTEDENQLICQYERKRRHNIEDKWPLKILADNDILFSICINLMACVIADKISNLAWSLYFL